MRSPLSGWVGGKFLLAKTIVPMIPDHVCYAEPFAGAGWILFRKDPSKSEVLNDLNGEVVNLYRVVQRHLEEFVRQFKWALTSRKMFEWAREVPPEGLTDIERAARFFYLHRLCFGGRMSGTKTFGYSATGPASLNLLRIEEDLSAAHIRLNGVHIENLPYAELIKRYDRPGTFFYVDPPYFNCEDHYGKGLFCREDFSRLADVLGGIKGKFLLSLNDTQEIRTIFRSFQIDEASTRYSCANSKSIPVVELLIRNY
ncbi:MAG: DNA adenine methylase [Magnetococcales bacterium]|nr:DNA adenine methylase [Magnetococcales bacterium]